MSLTEMERPAEAAVSTSPMQVRKRNGDLEPVDVNKIVRAVERCAAGLAGVDPLRVATKTISGLVDGATTTELDELSIRTAASLITEEPSYSRLAARLLATFIDKEVRNQGIDSLLAVDRAAGTTSAWSATSTAALVAANWPQARRRHRRRWPTSASSSSACARSTTATCCATPTTRGGHRDARSTSSCGSPAA